MMPNGPDEMDVVARAAELISDSDILEAPIRRDQRWSLMPAAAVLSAIAPGSVMRGAGSVRGLVNLFIFSFALL
jgi:hypothetical protein